MADDGGFTRVAPVDDGGFQRAAPPADTGGFARADDAQPKLNWRQRLAEIPAMVTDIPFAVGRSLRDSGIDAHQRLNPFSEAYRQGEQSDNMTGPGTFLGTGKGLFNAAMAIPSAVMQVGAAPLGHAWSAATGEPFHDPANEFSGEQVGNTAVAGYRAPQALGKFFGAPDVTWGPNPTMPGAPPPPSGPRAPAPALSPPAAPAATPARALTAPEPPSVRLRAAYETELAEQQAAGRRGAIVDVSSLLRRSGMPPDEFHAWLATDDAMSSGYRSMASTYSKDAIARKNRIEVQGRTHYGMVFDPVAPALAASSAAPSPTVPQPAAPTTPPQTGPQAAFWQRAAQAPQQFAPQPAAPVAPGTALAPVQPGPLRRGASTVEKIFSPETVDAHADAAVTLLRAATGKAARDTAITETALEPYHARVNALDPAGQLDFLAYVENRSGTPRPLPSSPIANAAMRDLQPVANELRAAFKHREAEIDSLPAHAGMHFIEDFFPHFWKDPQAAANFAVNHAGGAAKQGSGASLKARSIPTIEAGIRAGLVPIDTNPINMALRYVQSMDLYIASQRVRDAASAAGMIQYVQPKVMGASGHPNSFKVPDGWVPLEGRGARNATGGIAYAPEGFARVYNNFLSRGVAELGAEYGNAMTAARRGSNAITAMELGLSGYHALTMTQESMVNSLANGLSNLRGGRPIEALKNVGEVAVAPVSYAVKGKRLQNAYLGKGRPTPEMQQIAQLLEEGGGRAKGARHAPDYEFSRQGSYVTALKRGILKAQLIGDFKDAMGRPIRGTLAAGARHIGRIMDTVAQPLFEKYIPLVKNGAFFENMKAWLEQNPGATREQQVRAARQILDSVDNRFGEMVQDNVFWNRALKEIAMLSLRSWSWTVGGSIREIGGGVRDIVRSPVKARNPAEIGPNDKRWTQKMDYVIALPIVYGALAAIYQGLKTGEAPADVRDLLAPRTGGSDANSGEPERLLIPGYMKDVYGFLWHPRQEFANKVATGPRAVWDNIMNENWRRDPIRSPLNWNERDGFLDREEGIVEHAPQWLRDYWKYATETFGPITARNAIKGQKEGSNLNLLETTLGVRTAPRQFIDPEGHANMLTTMAQRKWQQKLKHDTREKARYGGTE